MGDYDLTNLGVIVAVRTTEGLSRVVSVTESPMLVPMSLLTISRVSSHQFRLALFQRFPPLLLFLMSLTLMPC